ncbi:MAG: sigma-70 family RNA polymerase sigma factor [Phycisphaerae bacterium]
MGGTSNGRGIATSPGISRTLDDRALFEVVVLPHLDSVYRLARALCRDEPDAEDLVQETFRRALKGFAGFELRAYGARPWLLRILHNVFYTTMDRRRRGPRRHTEVDLEGIEDKSCRRNGNSVSSVDAIDWDHFDEELKLEVNRLQTEYRAALLLWAIEGLSYREIAEICDCPVGTVMSRLYRARQILGCRLHSYARERRVPRQRLRA